MTKEVFALVPPRFRSMTCEHVHLDGSHGTAIRSPTSNDP
jgi:hypothetical protein